jgi:hypothetical protein
VATNQLGLPEERFWRMTLRKFNILWNQHREFNAPREREPGKNATAQKIGDNEKTTIDAIDFF